MKRGRIFIYLALIIIIAVGAGGGYLWLKRNPPKNQASATQVNPQINYVEVVTAGQNITPGTQITEAMLSTIPYPDTRVVQGMFTNIADVVGLFAMSTIPQGVTIMDSEVSATAGNVNLSNSPWAPLIPQGMTAVAIPIKGLASVAYGVRDGDYVDLIVSMLLVDVDPTTQSILPNLSAGVTGPLTGVLDTADQLVAVIGTGGAKEGSMGLDETLNQPLYLVPAEEQRPRLVTQMIMQNVQVLRVGTFPPPSESVSVQAGSSPVVATPTPTPTGQEPTAIVTRPDVVTLMVSPDDATMLVYLIDSGVKITLTLRNPNDTGPVLKTNAAMLEYLLTQYNIPVPAKLPYAVQPRLDSLVEKLIQGDAVTPVP
jgi:Flp pilus assembly protein CpaB